MKDEQKLQKFFDLMWKDYCALNPQAQAVFNRLTEFGERVVNDHIAFRTFSHPKIGIDQVASHFTKYGYKQIAEYEFVQKKLKAKHFEHSDPQQPKVFISALDLDKCSSFIRQIAESVAESIQEANLRSESFMLSGRTWKASFEIYKKLYLESEYAAWVYAHGFRPNHFTVDVNHLKKLKSIQDLNAFLVKNDFVLNTAGGRVKGTPADFLEQSSTMANEIPIKFIEGQFSIPGCYYEFAKRYPMKNGLLFQGFVAQSADKIFESTNRIMKE